jgi:hypothetical protein
MNLYQHLAFLLPAAICMGTFVLSLKWFDDDHVLATIGGTTSLVVSAVFLVVWLANVIDVYQHTINNTFNQIRQLYTMLGTL